VLCCGVASKRRVVLPLGLVVVQFAAACTLCLQTWPVPSTDTNYPSTIAKISLLYGTYITSTKYTFNICLQWRL